MEKTKIIALYLPQYHEIPENNEWWGKGFTEWTNVKKAKPIFDWQTQPKKPLNGNYYNLLNKETVQWQTELANKYGVYGFCYFHYYFNGRKILEKPAENLLKWKDIKQNFCFFWANVSWCRTWSNAMTSAGTSWTVENGVLGVNQGKKVLLEQTYGEEKDWQKHFYYLLDFFKDDRYINKDNKPLFFIYQINDIPCAKEMFALWNNMAKEHGFDGIHLVSVNEEPSDVPSVEAIAHYGFHKASRSNLFTGIGNKIINRVKRDIGIKLNIDKYKKDVWDYETMWKNVIEVKPYGNLPNYPGAFVNYDDTPRRGADGTVMKNISPEIFKKYMEIQLNRSKTVFQSEYLLLDAWNEWGEGNYLEPDEEWKYAFLEALKQVVDENEDI